MSRKIKKTARNNRLVDVWSVVHVVSGAGLMWLLGTYAGWTPFAVWLLMLIYEPIEIFVLSPLLEKCGILFGYEGWRNSLSDICFNTLGIGVALLLGGLL